MRFKDELPVLIKSRINFQNFRNVRKQGCKGEDSAFFIAQIHPAKIRFNLDERPEPFRWLAPECVPFSVLALCIMMEEAVRPDDMAPGNI